MVRRRTSSFFPSAIAALVAAVAVSACSDASRAPELSVGLAKRDITPDAATAPPDGRVYLGGYGLGPERLSTGVLAPIHARAFVVSNGTDTVAFVENETQGAFGAYRSGPFGLTDAAAAIEAASGGAIPRTHVFANSDHSHAGPDTTGVWGGLPETYLAHWRDQIVGAVMDAYAARRPAELWFGSTDATDLITSQFHQPPNDVVDGELRVLLAVEPGGSAGRPFGALVNYSAHATVMGGGNTLVSADWPGPFAERLERDLGIETAVVMVADVGRTQPRDGDVPGNDDYEKLAGYADRVESRALAAASSATRRSGTDIAATWLFLREPYANPLFPLSFLGSIISRSDRPPWLDDEAIGTLVGAARVGDVFFAAIPGEGYPAIHFLAERSVPEGVETFTFGLANDQLGYLIAPESGYPQVLAAAPDNDNAIFNVSPKIGDHVGCVVLAAARAIGMAVADDPPECAPYAAEDHSLPF
ncbi:MAG TPA: hypothetical protein VFD92_02860 [Candidatus Binatia bacterium]|nr:hypothetical protein [Candidatus Binatia bacterium]